MTISLLFLFCFIRPEEIVTEIYPEYATLQSTNNNIKKFDEVLLDIVNIIVSYDMGWSKRGNGKSYDSLNGYGAIIGFLSGKVLDYATRNRKCMRCDRGHAKDDHDCRKNFTGSAKAMEPSVGTDLVNHSTILKEVGVNVRVVIGDEDSSTIAAIRKGNAQKIFKLADTNHLRKHFISELYGLKSTFKEMRKKETIPHLKKCFGYAVKQNKGKTAHVAATLRSIPDHLFGEHEHCGNWCNHKDPDSTSKAQKIKLQDPELYKQLHAIFTKYANNASKFSVAASSQANESLNGIMAHKAPKNCCYSLSESCDYRLASSVATKNEGERHVLYVQEKLCVSPGKYTASYLEKRDKVREQRAIKAKLPSTKSRRNFLVQEREALRKKTEESEGMQYQSNCGIDKNTEDFNILFDLQMLCDNLATISISIDNCDIVYFDLETSGFANTADILQIAAKLGEQTFSVYVNPSQPIDSGAFEATGLQNIGGHLFLYGKPVDSIALKDALNAFQQFLSLSSKSCILVAHNARFDSSRLIRAIINNCMIDNFKNVAGFSDSLGLLKKRFPERKGEGMFKLEKLAQDLLQLNGNGKFHEATYDVEILEKLTSSFILRKDLVEVCKPYKESLMTAIILPTLTALKGVASSPILKKIAIAGITYETLKKLYTEHGREGIFQLFSSKGNNDKPRVTKDKRVIDKFVRFFETNKN